MQRCVYSVILTLAVVGLTVAAIFLPSMAIPLLIVSTSLFAVVNAVAYTKSSRICSQCVIVLFYIVCLAVTKDPVISLLPLLTFFPVGWAVGQSVHTKSNLNSTGATALLTGSVFCVIVFFFYAFYSTYPDISLQTAAENIQNTVLTYIENFLYELVFPDSGQLSEYLYTYSFSELSSDIFSYAPTIIACWFLLSATVAFFVLKFTFDLFQQDVSFMGGFGDFRVSKTGAVVYFIATLLTLISSDSVFLVAFVNFYSAMSVVMTYAGISLVGFFLEFKNIPVILRRVIMAVIIICSIIPIGISSILSLVGLLDSYLNIRERLCNSGV